MGSNLPNRVVSANEAVADEPVGDQEDRHEDVQEARSEDGGDAEDDGEDREEV